MGLTHSEAAGDLTPDGAKQIIRVMGGTFRGGHLWLPDPKCVHVRLRVGRHSGGVKAEDHATGPRDS